MENFEVARLDGYFRQITEHFPAAGGASTVVITHLLADRPSFLHAISRISTVRAVLPKPRSIHPATLRSVERHYRVDELSRERCGDADHVTPYVEQLADGQPVVLLDVAATSPPPWYSCVSGCPVRSSGWSRTPRTATAGTSIWSNLRARCSRWRAAP